MINKIEEQEKKEKASLFLQCEALFVDPDARKKIDELFEKEYQDFTKKVIVLDDDPTGIQTVHDVDVYTDWTKESLKNGLSSPEKLFFVLTNSRSFSAQKTTQVHTEIAENAAEAGKETDAKFLMISRGDSTLRGHYPLETQILKNTLEFKLGLQFDGEVLCPFFKEGGRFTVNGVHYVTEKDTLIPAGMTEFAKDKTFGYEHSFLPNYIEEKSDGKVKAEEVALVSLEKLRKLQFDEIEAELSNRKGYTWIVADAIEEADVKAFAIVLMRLMKKGKNYLIRSAAAVPKVFGNISNRPLLTKEELTKEYNPNDQTYLPGGMVLVGSHVKKTTRQLECLKESNCPLEWIEFHVAEWKNEGGLEKEAATCASLAETAMANGKTAVVYTSRTVIDLSDQTPEQLLAISVRISDALTSVVSRLAKRPRFLIAKGGITSSDVGTIALAVKKARVLGQVQPGIPVWKIGEESRFPGMSYIIFPGNVGDEDTLRKIVEVLNR